MKIITSKKIGLLFAGQGAQYIGMGRDFYDNYDYVRAMYKEASAILGYDLTKLVFEENENINQTKYTQPAILITSLCIYEVLKREYNLSPIVTAGFSLGEYSALNACGVFDFSQIVYLIKHRALYMEEDAKKSKGGMAAIIGMERDTLESLCNQLELVKIANYNCPNQLVVSGLYDSVIELVERAKQNGARRAVMLNVSGGFHTQLMEDASKRMYDLVKGQPFNQPNFDIIMNCNYQPLDINHLPELMKAQISSSVYFEDSIRLMMDTYSVDLFVEIGPGNVLSGFVKKINQEAKIIAINKVADLDILGGM